MHVCDRFVCNYLTYFINFLISKYIIKYGLQIFNYLSLSAVCYYNKVN